jgi:hypothetical protein
MSSRTGTKHDAAQRSTEPSYPRDKLMMRALTQRTAWRTEYGKALLTAGPPGAQEISATHEGAPT